MVLQEHSTNTSAGLPLRELAAEVGITNFPKEVLQPESVRNLASALRNRRESIRGLVSRAFAIMNVTNVQRNEHDGVVTSIDRGFVNGTSVILKHHSGGERAQDQTLFEAIAAEYLHVMGVPGICLLFTLAMDDAGNIFQVYEDLSIKGTFLDEWISFTDYEEIHKDVKTPLAIRDFFQIAFSLATTIDKAAAVGIFHSDLKVTQVAAANEQTKGFVYPRRKLVTFDDVESVTKLADWDASNIVQAQLNADRKRANLAYAAPETLLNPQQNIDARSEVFSLGVLLFELLTNSLPHISEGAANFPSSILVEEHLLPFIKTGILPNLNLLRTVTALDYELAARIFQKTLSPDPELRFRSCQEFVLALSQAWRG